VLKACPEIAVYAVDGIGSWRDLMVTAAQVRGYLGVSPSAYEDACHVMGQEIAAIVIAGILQRVQHINSAGGYLRVLTDKARAGEFSVGPMLMSLLRTQSQSCEARAG
ncbi:MAG: replication initiation protein RepC, partial [Mesorhizobium sp.]